MHIGEICTRSVVACSRQTSALAMTQRMRVAALESENVYDATCHMRGKGIRRLPVIDGQGHRVGVLTADDVTRTLAEELTELTRRIPPDQARREQSRCQPTHGAPRA